MMINKMWTVKAWNPAGTAYLDWPAKSRIAIAQSFNVEASREIGNCISLKHPTHVQQ